MCQPLVTGVLPDEDPPPPFPFRSSFPLKVTTVLPYPSQSCKHSSQSLSPSEHAFHQRVPREVALEGLYLACLTWERSMRRLARRTDCCWEGMPLLAITQTRASVTEFNKWVSFRPLSASWVAAANGYIPGQRIKAMSHWSKKRTQNLCAQASSMPTVLQKEGQIDLGSDICTRSEILKAQLYLPLHPLLSQLRGWLEGQAQLNRGRLKHPPNPGLALSASSCLKPLHGVSQLQQHSHI